MRRTYNRRDGAVHAKRHRIEEGSIVRYLDDIGMMRCARIAEVDLEDGLVFFSDHIQIGKTLRQWVNLMTFDRDKFLRIVPRPA